MNNGLRINQATVLLALHYSSSGCITIEDRTMAWSLFALVQYRYTNSCVMLDRWHPDHSPDHNVVTPKETGAVSALLMIENWMNVSVLDYRNPVAVPVALSCATACKSCICKLSSLPVESSSSSSSYNDVPITAFVCIFQRDRSCYSCTIWGSPWPQLGRPTLGASSDVIGLDVDGSGWIST